MGIVIAIRIISSISVKPRRRRAGVRIISPFGIGSSISRLVRCFGIYVEYILPAEGLRLRIVTVAPQAPVGGIRHRVLWNPAEIFHLLIHRAGGLDAIHQLLEAF